MTHEERSRALASLNKEQLEAIEDYFKYTTDPKRYEDIEPTGNIEYKYGYIRGARKTATTFLHLLSTIKERVAKKEAGRTG